MLGFLRCIIGCELFFAVLFGVAFVRAEPPGKISSATQDNDRRIRLDPRKDGSLRKPFDPALVLERFMVAKDGGLLLVPVVINGRQCQFALDTGATHSFYDKSFRTLLGDPIRSEKIWTPAREITQSIYRSPVGKVGNLSLPRDSVALCVDMQKIREVSGQDLNGILGMDFLRKHIFRMDFDRGEVTFMRTIGPDPGERVPLKFQGNFPYVMAVVRGMQKPSRFLVDTGHAGFASGDLNADAFANLADLGALKLDGQSNVETMASESRKGMRKRRLGWLGGISLGDYRHEKLLFGVSNKNILGLKYWSRYVVTFDFPNSFIYLKKGRKFEQPDLRDMSGLHIIRRKRKTVVYSVDNESPAENAGIKPQDLLLKINDENTTDMTLSTIRRLLSADGKTCRIIVIREGKEMMMSIILKDRRLWKRKGIERKGVGKKGVRDSK